MDTASLLTDSYTRPAARADRGDFVRRLIDGAARASAGSFPCKTGRRCPDSNRYRLRKRHAACAGSVAWQAPLYPGEIAEPRWPSQIGLAGFSAKDNEHELRLGLMIRSAKMIASGFHD
jgi:hypothetical protein